MVREGIKEKKKKKDKEVVLVQWDTRYKRQNALLVQV